MTDIVSVVINNTDAIKKIIVENTPLLLQYQIGASGVGVPTGGVKGQTLTKNSSTNFDTQWQYSGLSAYNSNCFNFYSYYPAAVASTADLTTPIQEFLLWCQLQFLELKNTALTDQVQRACVNAYFPAGRYTITSPIIGLEYVNIICDGIFVRNGSSGVSTSFYTGDTTSKALANLLMPEIILPPRSHAQKLNIYCNSNGTDRGSGLFVGKNWQASSLVITSAGTGYSVNDILTFANPSISPYIATTAKVLSVNGLGAITGIVIVESGAYSLPPVLQAYQWTAANGFSNIFDTNHNLKVSGGTGSGASIAITWEADYTGVSTQYNGGHGGIISDYILDHIYVVQGQTLTGVFGMQCYGLNSKIGEVEISNFFSGILLRFVSDLHAAKLNTVNCSQPLSLYKCTSISCSNVVLDTPIGGSSSLEIDLSTRIKLSGMIFFRNSVNNPSPKATIGIGYFNTAPDRLNSNISLDFILDGAGSGGDAANISKIGTPALYLDYVQDYDIKLNIVNRIDGYSGTFPTINSVVQFGTNCKNGKISANTDQMLAALYSGTLPTSCDLDIFDADAPIVSASITATITGTITNNDILRLTFTNSNFTSTWAFPRTISVTALTGNTTTDLATNLAAAINADISLQKAGVIATSSTNVVTISQAGIDANSTVITKAVTGAATEIITLSNSGIMAGSISGGKLRAGGIYELFGDAAPVNGVTGTGWGKAVKGSKYTDNSTGSVYTNGGTAASPFWKPANGVAILAQAYANSFHVGTGEFNLANVKIPANRLSVNGAVRITAQWAYPNNANTKTMIIRHSLNQGDVSGGTLVMNNAQTTKASSRYQYVIQNSNSLTAQICGINNGTFYDSSGAAVVGSIDTTKDSYINFNINNSNASDNSGLISYLIEWIEP